MADGPPCPPSKEGLGTNLEKGDVGPIAEGLSGAEASVSSVFRITLSWGTTFRGLELSAWAVTEPLGKPPRRSGNPKSPRPPFRDSPERDCNLGDQHGE